MADYKGRIRPPVYDGEGTATYPDVFYPETKSDLVKDPVSGETVAQQINEIDEAITELNEEIENLGSDKVDQADIVDNLTEGGSDKVLSAEQGKALGTQINALDARVDTIITTPITSEAAAEEVVDARGTSASLGARLNGIDSQLAELIQLEAPQIVSSVEEMTDTAKHYVNQTTGTIWAYMKHTNTTGGSVVPNFVNVFDADAAMIGYRWSGSGMSPTATAHCILSDFIPCNLSSGEHTIRIKNAQLHGYTTNAGIAYFTSNVNDTVFAHVKNLEATPTEEEDGVFAYKLGESDGSMISGYTNTRYIRCVAVQYSNETLVTQQTLENAQGIIITIDEPITYTEVPASTETYYEWTDTGISYAPTFKTDLIGVLGENNVVYLSDNLPSGTYTLKYGNETYDTIGTITIE
jgi:hypothetical protein